ncbi:MAG: hypothetical protein ACTHK0_10520 [Ginsengibacter sp.]
MKTTLLFSAALFLATASFAQTNVNTNATVKKKSEIKANKVKTSADASSETNLQLNATKVEHKTAAAEKSSASATANEKGKLISDIAADKPDGSVQGNEKGKLISSIASDGKSESGSVHSDINGNANANVNYNGHLKTNAKKITHSAKKIKASSANTRHTGSAAIHAVKVPVSVKTQAGVAIQIK